MLDRILDELGKTDAHALLERAAAGMDVQVAAAGSPARPGAEHLLEKIDEAASQLASSQVEPAQAKRLMAPLPRELADIPGMAALSQVSISVPMILPSETVTARAAAATGPAEQRRLYESVVAVLHDVQRSWTGYASSLSKPGEPELRLSIAYDGDAFTTIPRVLAVDSTLADRCTSAIDHLVDDRKRMRAAIELSVKVMEIVAGVLAIASLTWWKALLLMGRALQDLFELVRSAA